MSIACRLSVALSFRRSGELRHAHARRVSRRARSVSSCPAEQHEGVLERAGSAACRCRAGPTGGARRSRGRRGPAVVHPQSRRAMSAASWKLVRAESRSPAFVCTSPSASSASLWASSSAMPPRAITARAIAVQAGGLLVGERRGRLIAGTSGVLDRLSPDRRVVDGSAVRADGRLDVVEGKLREVLGHGRAVHHLELAGDAPVEPHAPTRRKLVVEGLANQVVREPIATTATGHRQQEAGLDRLVDHVERPVFTDVADPCKRIQAELGPEGRAEAQRFDRGASEVADAPGDDGMDTGRDGHPKLIGAADVVEASLRRQQPDGLADEQWIAVRRAPHGGGNRARSAPCPPRPRSPVPPLPPRARAARSPATDGSRAISAMAGVNGCSGVSSTSR